MRLRPRLLLIAFSLVALALASPASARNKYLRFKLLSVKGEQTVTWTNSRSFGCGSVARSGSQTIAFESTGAAQLKLLRVPRSTQSGKRHGFTYVGVNFIRANWTWTRSFQQGPPPACPPGPADTAQASDCGTQGPFPVPIDVGWRDGAVNLRGVAPLGKPRARYQTCEYDGFHEFDLIDSKGRLSQRRLTSRRHRTLTAKVSEKLSEPGEESGGSQTTSLNATVTLKRIR
jgi:hypothetical protein